MRLLRIIASSFNLTRFPAVRPQLIPQPHPTTRIVLGSAPTIPFIGSLFSSRAQAQAQNQDMAPPPDHRSEDAWRAVLSPGEFYSYPRV